MKIIKCLLFISILGISSCAKDFDEMNQNPNAPTTMDEDNLLKYSQIASVGGYNLNIEMDQRGLMQWMMYHAVINGYEGGKEYYQPNSKDEFWRKRYVDALMNAQETINICEGDYSLNNKKQIAKIWKAYLFIELVDIWGDIPYTEALKGTSQNILLPAYDKHSSIYLNIVDELTDAANSITQEEQEEYGAADMIFGGDIDKWKRFANSLCLRLAIRISNIDPVSASEIFNNLQDAEFISSNIENAEFPFGEDRKNFLYEHKANKDGFETFCWPSKFLTNLMVDGNDPRLVIFFTPAQIPIHGEYRGIPNLLETGDPEWGNYEDPTLFCSALGEWFLQENTPKLLMGYSEVCFLKAEAALNGWWSENAQTLYELGIEASISYYNSEDVTSNDISNYIQSAPTVSQEEIIKQKYISFAYMNVLEAWADYRRTGFPVLTDYWDQPIDESKMPKRFTYPSSEYFQNRDNVSKAVSSMGGTDSEFTKLWWDVN